MRLAAAILLVSLPSAAFAASGSVNFTFTGYEGPYAVVVGNADPLDPANYALAGAINGATPAFTGTTPDGFGNNNVLGTTALSGNLANFVYTNIPDGIPNAIGFTPASFDDIAVGEEFVLGTIAFTNGQWFSGDVANGFVVPAYFNFTLTTSSATPEFNQTISGRFVVTTNQVIPQDCSSAGGQQDQADFVSVESTANVGSLGSLRVFDQFCKAASATNFGTIDLIGRFGSLELVGLRDPGGSGFFVPGTGTGPIGGVPEPASWAMLIAGFGLIGAATRRRRGLAT